MIPEVPGFSSGSRDRPGITDDIGVPEVPARAPYPLELERNVVLRDGTRLRLRPIRPEDEDRLIRFHDRLSAHTLYQRFFAVVRHLPPDWAHRLANVDYRKRLALLAEHGHGASAELVGVARYEPTDRPDTAEIAFVVLDSWQNRGLGTILLDALLEAAASRGLHQFRAYVLASNARMLDMLLRFTDVIERHTEDAVVALSFTRRERAVDPRASHWIKERTGDSPGGVEE